MLLWIWSCFPLRMGARPSISSKKMIEGCSLVASVKSIRSWRSASPTHLDRMSAPFRMKKVTFWPEREAVAARARAHRVLPVPGGPCSSTPRGGAMWNRSKTSGYTSGRKTISFRACT